MYELITRRFLSIFYPAAVYQKFSLCVSVKGEKFFANFGPQLLVLDKLSGVLHGQNNAARGITLWRRGLSLLDFISFRYYAAQVLTPTLMGEMIYDVVRGSIKALLDPSLTASWEKGLTLVAEGEITSKEYMDKLTGSPSRSLQSKCPRPSFHICLPADGCQAPE